MFRALSLALLFTLALSGCETEADRRKQRLDRVAHAIDGRLSSAALPAVPYGDTWVAGDVRVIVGEGIDVDRAANALDWYRIDPDAYAESARPIPEAGPRAVTLSNGRPSSRDRSGGTLPELAEALRPPPPAGQMGDPNPHSTLPQRRGTLDLAVGGSIPYATFAEVLLTVARERYSARLVVRLPAATGRLPVHFPSVAGSCWSASCIEALLPRRSIPDPEELEVGDHGPHARLELTVAIDERGVDLFASGGALARGCGQVRPSEDEGPTVPRRNGAIDSPAVEECLSAIDEQFPDEVAVLIQPEADTPFAEVALVASLAFGDDRFPGLFFAAPE